MSYYRLPMGNETYSQMVFFLDPDEYACGGEPKSIGLATPGNLQNILVPFDSESTVVTFDQTLDIDQIAVYCGTNASYNLEYTGSRLFGVTTPDNIPPSYDVYGDLIKSNVEAYGVALMYILSAVAAIAAGVLVFRTGWRLVKDRSFTIGGFYVRQVPYKGYNRFRSRAWNMKNTLK